MTAQQEIRASSGWDKRPPNNSTQYQQRGRPAQAPQPVASRPRAPAPMQRKPSGGKRPDPTTPFGVGEFDVVLCTRFCGSSFFDPATNAPLKMSGEYTIDAPEGGLWVRSVNFNIWGAERITDFLDAGFGVEGTMVRYRMSVASRKDESLQYKNNPDKDVYTNECTALEWMAEP